MSKRKIRLVSTVFVGTVFLVNVQAGVIFYFRPEYFMRSFELSGIPGSIAVAGTGLLFLMWNIPYAFALFNPLRYQTALLQTVIMQTFGVVGETILLLRIPLDQHLLLQSSIRRFIIFDSAGLLLLIAALILVWKYRNRKTARE